MRDSLIRKQGRYLARISKLVRKQEKMLRKMTGRQDQNKLGN